MNKYTRSQLRDMARRFLDFHRKQDSRCFIVIMHLGSMSDLEPDEVIAKIQELAK